VFEGLSDNSEFLVHLLYQSSLWVNDFEKLMIGHHCTRPFKNSNQGLGSTLYLLHSEVLGSDNSIYLLDSGLWDVFFFTGKANLLNNPGKFMQDMKDFDKENIKEGTVKKVNAIIESEDFTMEKVKSASNALVAILKWSSAMMQYHELLKIVNPKRILVKEMNEKLVIVRADLKKKLARLKAVEEKIESLEKMFREKKELEEKL
jgi:hypothetical protein